MIDPKDNESDMIDGVSYSKAADTVTSKDTSIVDINVDDASLYPEQTAIDKALSPLSTQELADLDSFNELQPVEPNKSQAERDLEILVAAQKIRLSPQRLMAAKAIAGSAYIQ